jgi:predicted ester cyclase
MEQNKAVVLRFNKEIIAGKNTALVDELFAPDFVNRTVRPGYPTGSDGVLKFLSENLWTGFSDITVEIHDQIAEGDKVTTRKTIHGIHTGPFLGQPATNKKIGIFIIDIIRLRDGKYVEHWGVFDTQHVINQFTI